MSIDLSLDRIQKLVSALPPYTRPTCHVTGTNGKGSVVAIISSILQAAGYKTGRFNSPHLVHVHDCICINGSSISKDDYESMHDQVRSKDQEHACGASSFELLTATALQIFEQARCDVVVLEVGMGGRLDATNVIPDDCVLVSAMTGVDLDHQAFLGDTVEKIAQEKVGIARRGKPFVLGPQQFHQVKNIVNRAVTELGGHMIEAVQAEVTSAEGRSSAQAADWWPPPSQRVSATMQFTKEQLRLEYPLHGRHQLDNLGTAIAIIDNLVSQRESTEDTVQLCFSTRITPQTIYDGVRHVSWPGRLSFHRVSVPGCKDPVKLLADGAHNAASAQTLSSYASTLLDDCMRSSHPNHKKIHVAYILALSHSPPKTPESVFHPLLQVRSRGNNEGSLIVRRTVAAIRFTPPENMPWVKSVDPATIRSALRICAPDVEIWTDGEDETYGPARIMDVLHGISSQNEEQVDFVILAGSLYAVADLYRGSHLIL